MSGRLLNFTSFAASVSVSGISALRDVDAIWVYNSPATVSAAAGLSKWLHGRPHVLHVMDLWPDSILAAGFAGSGRAFGLLRHGLDLWCSQTYEWASPVAYITPGVGNLLRERGVPAPKLHYVPVWADEAVFYPTQDDRLRKELNLEDDLVLLYAGALGPIQGIGTLIEACARVRDLKGFHCLIVGSGAEETALQRRAAELKLENVTFLGSVPKARMTGVMATGDVHFVSLRNDPLSAITMPSKMQATLASGKPLIVAVEGDAAAVGEASGAGIPITPGDVHALESAIRAAHSMGRAELSTLGARAQLLRTGVLVRHRYATCLETPPVSSRDLDPPPERMKGRRIHRRPLHLSRAIPPPPDAGTLASVTTDDHRTEETLDA